MECTAPTWNDIEAYTKLSLMYVRACKHTSIPMNSYLRSTRTRARSPLSLSFRNKYDTTVLYVGSVGNDTFVYVSVWISAYTVPGACLCIHVCMYSLCRNDRVYEGARMLECICARVLGCSLLNACVLVQIRSLPKWRREAHWHPRGGPR